MRHARLRLHLNHSAAGPWRTPGVVRARARAPEARTSGWAACVATALTLPAWPLQWQRSAAVWVSQTPTKWSPAAVYSRVSFCKPRWVGQPLHIMDGPGIVGVYVCTHARMHACMNACMRA
jgi:hypothetical protein